MKQLAKPAKHKQRRHQKQPQSPPRSLPQARPGRSRWVWVILCGLILAGGGTWAALEFFLWNKIPPALVGKWEVSGGPMSGGTFDFSRNGTLEIRQRTGGSFVTLKARAAVTGKTLATTTHNPQTRGEETHWSTIQELTADSLILELEKGEVLKLVRRQ